MSDLNPPPKYIREAFRRELIRRRGSVGAFGLGYADEIKRFAFYLKTVEAFISEQEAAEIAKLKQNAAGLSEESKGEFWSYYYPVHWNEIFRSNLRPSFLISLISFIETQLRAICRDVEIIARTPISATVIKGGLLERSRRFLETFADLSEADAQKWTNISLIYDVRNVFVHHAGYVPEFNHEKRLRQSMQSLIPGIAASNDHLTLGDEFCPFTLRTTEEFLDAISKDLASLCERLDSVESSAEK
jgi:hypothetical protein